MQTNSNQSSPSTLPIPLLTPHPKAPLFSRPDALKVLGQLADEIATGRFPTNETFRQLFRQAGYVNLWFYAKFICGAAGEYDRLDKNVHLDMCNFRQSCLEPGGRYAMFLPRGVGKSKICTETGTGWELNRDPSLRVRITNAIADYAQDFMLSVKAIFDNNEVHAWLYPETLPPPNMKRWNDKEIVMPNRPKHSRMGSVEYGGVGGAAASHHFGLHVVDDMISEQSLNSMRGSNALMEHTKHWFWTNAPSLLDDTIHSRIIVIGTRYAVDDVYDDIISRARSFSGYPMKGGIPKPEGKWDIYYRKIIEDGEITFPNNHTKESLDEMAADDYWTFVTQYMNDPREAGLAEFVQYKLKIATMEFFEDEWYISWHEGDMDFRVPLSELDVIMTVDPAATERYISAKTSRSALCVLATHYSGRKFIIDLKVGFVEPNVLFDWIFSTAEKWKKYLRGTYLESNAGFKVLAPLLRTEQNERGIYLGLNPFAAVGEKVARIRSDLDPEFSKGNLYTLGEFYPAIMEEAEAFPQSSRRDILDTVSVACRESRLPASPEEQAAANDADEWFLTSHRSAAGY